MFATSTHPLLSRRSEPTSGNIDVSSLPENLTELQVNILTVIYVFEVVAICFVALRIYCRLKRLKRLLVTDWLLLVALLLQIAVQIINIFEMLEGLRSWANHKAPSSYTFDAIFITFAVFWAMRMSISLLFLEIFNGKQAKYIIYGSMILVTLSSLTSLIFLLSYCVPILHESPEVLFAGCSYQSLIAMELACATGLLFDLCAVILPMIPIWQLRMSKAKKISVTIIFMLGWLTIASSTIRLYVATKLLMSGPQPPGEMSNFTIFAAVELHTGLIASSLIASWGDIRRWFHPLKVRILQSIHSSGAHDRSEGAKELNTDATDSIWSRVAGWRKNRQARVSKERRRSFMSTTIMLNSTRMTAYGDGTQLEARGSLEELRRPISDGKKDDEGVLIDIRDPSLPPEEGNRTPAMIKQAAGGQGHERIEAHEREPV